MMGVDAWSQTDKRKIATIKYTGSATLNETFTPTSAIRLLSISIHLGGASATSENFTVKLDSVYGAAYDVIFSSQNMNTLDQKYFEYGDLSKYFEAGDKIDLDWGNTNLETYGLLIKYEII